MMLNFPCQRYLETQIAHRLLPMLLLFAWICLSYLGSMTIYRSYLTAKLVRFGRRAKRSVWLQMLTWEKT